MNFVMNLLKPLKLGSGKEGQSEEDWNQIAAQEQKHFSFESLVAATKDFHHTHKLGQGGFGSVYRGKLNDGREIAVKKLSLTSIQGKKEFVNEVKLLARVQHRNVVNLLGYCIHGEEKLLVYEYVINQSLEKHFFKSPRKEELNWKRLHDIISGIAKGLLYLHEESHSCIIHRDIKASNILLDEKWVPKIADFGMARLFPENQTHVNTRIVGTSGYMAPEYMMHGYLSKAADVFSFGVVVLELISGRRNSSINLDVDAHNLVDWAYKQYKKGRSLEIVERTLAASEATDQIAKCIQVGLLCVQSNPKLRPDMGRVVVMLSRKHGTLDDLQISRPGLPGVRYRRSHHGQGYSSASDSQSLSHSTSNTYGSSSGVSTRTTTTTSGTPSTPAGATPARDRGKRPMVS
ncbi:hypothetical protein SAY86_026451 [Trapa natans]|uniref:Protein kinase domain-containing protein n=1 Tax=Trapa natans TaxID=22666 RepID=A0AAN7QEI8_TRANT|nr:hypothetical protein SAY86_026451 [Trapa natans]